MTLLDNLLGLLTAQQTNRRTDGRQRSSDVTAVLPALSQLRQTTNTLFTRYNRLSNRSDNPFCNRFDNRLYREYA